MAWEVHETHVRRYPDEGWTMEECIEEDDAWRARDPEHPAADGWPIWYFRFSKPDEGPGAGTLPAGPILDVHSHCYVDSFAPRMRAYFESFGSTVYDPATLGGIAERRARLGVTHSVVLPVPTNERQVPQFNEWLKYHLDDEGIIPFMGVYPWMDDPVSEIHRCAELGFKGLKLHPVNQHFRMADPRMFPIYEAAIEENLVILFHTGSNIDFDAKGDDWDCTAPEIDKYFEKFPYERTILAHFGGPAKFRYLPEYHPEWPGYLDTAFQLGHVPDDFVLECVESFGADRILFGTDSPWDDTGEFLTRIAHMGLTEQQQRAILYDNGARLLGLPTREEYMAQHGMGDVDQRRAVGDMTQREAGAIQSRLDRA